MLPSFYFRKAYYYNGDIRQNNVVCEFLNNVNVDQILRERSYSCFVITYNLLRIEARLIPTLTFTDYMHLSGIQNTNSKVQYSTNNMS